MSVRYHLDENVDVAVAIGLRQRGIDISVSHEESLLGADDQSQLGFCTDSSRVLFTHDSDFLRIAATGQAHNGIIYCPPKAYSIGEMIRRLVVLWRERDVAYFANKVEYL